MSDKELDVQGNLTLYASGPALLREALAGLREQDLDGRLPKGGWSIRQYVHHVADGDQLWAVCIRLALGGAGEGFDLRWYWARPQDEWAKAWNYGGREIDPSLALLDASRRHVVTWINSLPDGLARSTSFVASDGTRGSLCVAEVVHSQGHHVVGHCEDIRRIRAALNLQGSPGRMR